MSKINSDNWYVYRHIRLDKNEPFYIGIGNKSNHARAYEKHPSKRNNIWVSITSKTEYDVEIIFESVSKDFAAKKEMEFINLYGRIDLNSGTLCNLTDGGDGIHNCIRSYETKEKLRQQKLGSKNPMFGKKQSHETLLKRNVFSPKKRSDETKRKQSLASIKSGQAKKTALIDYKTNEIIGIFHSMSEAIRTVGLDTAKYSSKASLVANGKRNHVKGYKFQYL